MGGCSLKQVLRPQSLWPVGGRHALCVPTTGHGPVPVPSRPSDSLVAKILFAGTFGVRVAKGGGVTESTHHSLVWWKELTRRKEFEGPDRHGGWPLLLYHRSEYVGKRLPPLHPQKTRGGPRAPTVPGLCNPCGGNSLTGVDGHLAIDSMDLAEERERQADYGTGVESPWLEFELRCPLGRRACLFLSVES